MNHPDYPFELLHKSRGHTALYLRERPDRGNIFFHTDAVFPDGSPLSSLITHGLVECGTCGDPVFLRSANVRERSE